MGLLPTVALNCLFLWYFKRRELYSTENYFDRGENADTP
jgi:hypothetical protein